MDLGGGHDGSSSVKDSMFIPESVSGGNHDAEPSPKKKKKVVDASRKLWTGRFQRNEGLR